MERFSAGQLQRIGHEREHWHSENSKAISDSDAQGARYVNRLFMRLKEIFPAWKAAFPTVEHEEAARMQWTQALIENGCATIPAIQAGLAAARRHDGPFVPSCGQFIAWARAGTKLDDLPTELESLNQALGMGGEMHAATRYALAQIDGYLFRRLELKDAQKLWAEAWRKTLAHVGAGGELPAAPIALEKLAQDPVPAAEAADFLSDMLRNLKK